MTNPDDVRWDALDVLGLSRNLHGTIRLLATLASTSSSPRLRDVASPQQREPDPCAVSRAPTNRSTVKRPPRRWAGASTTVVPDEEGSFSYSDGRVDVHFAHRRLSIIDLQHGQQPFVKQPFVLCYNGELYNFRELRAELVAGGARFTTTSDTEVVLESWRRWGPRCLRRFRGMFAFALLDQVSGSLFLARDQFGIKPLHYIRRKDGVVFASELKALVSTFGSELRMQPQALVASMLYYWVPDQQCSVRGVEKLQPGTFAEFRPDGTSRVECYWDIVEEAASARERPTTTSGRSLKNRSQRTSFRTFRCQAFSPAALTRAS